MIESEMKGRVVRPWRAPIAAALVISAASISAPRLAVGYAGEAGSGDGPDAAYQGLAVSTHHTHLTRALAYCAGFPALTGHRNPINPLVAPDAAQWAERIALNDELTDQGTITGQDANGDPVGPVWTNLNTEDWSYTLPSAAAVGCADDLTMVYPITQSNVPPPIPNQAFFDPASGFFTHRFGPWAGQFHFAQDDALADDLAVLRAFAFGETETLRARSLYGFGAAGANAWSGACYDQRIEAVATGALEPGSARPSPPTCTASATATRTACAASTGCTGRRRRGTTTRRWPRCRRPARSTTTRSSSAAPTPAAAPASSRGPSRAASRSSTSCSATPWPTASRRGWPRSTPTAAGYAGRSSATRCRSATT